MKTIKFTALSIVGIALLSAGSIHAIESMHGSGNQNVNQNIDVRNNKYDVDNLAYYGDWDSDRVFVIDVDNMALLTTVEETGDGPYGIDQQGTDKAYALTRKTESLTVVNNFTIKNTGLIVSTINFRVTRQNSQIYYPFYLKKA